MRPIESETNGYLETVLSPRQYHALPNQMRVLASTEKFKSKSLERAIL
jgi:hypothetical protein